MLEDLEKNFLEIPLREDIKPPDFTEIVKSIVGSLRHLNPELYSFELIQYEPNRTFKIYKNGQLFGRYEVEPGLPGKPTWNKGEDIESENEWRRIWLMIWTDLATKFGRWPWSNTDYTDSETDRKDLQKMVDANTGILMRKTDQDEMLAACIAWAKKQKYSGMNLEDFLEEKFGTSHAVLNVNKLKFYRELRKAHKQGYIDKDEKGYYTYPKK